MSVILPDAPEVMALAGLASIPASKMAAAFNNPENFFAYLTLEEVGRLTDAVNRLQSLSVLLVEAAETYTVAAKAMLAEVGESAD